ncbi:MAG: geranylgeranyl reductase family protein [Candidatus Moranbacteria bacterium]|nr:geranylgeranyl reductase family protein [Candidatus Moranbacteria bacterium]
MSDENAYDVIIIGAGPAGSTLAYELAKKRKKVLILEKERFPRDKPCGGGLTAKVNSLLQFDISHLIEGEISGISFTKKFRDEISGPVMQTSIRIVERAGFDNFLAEKAKENGAEMIQSAKAIEIEDTSDCVRVAIEDGRHFQGKILVGADGALGITSRVVLSEKDPLFSFLVVLKCETQTNTEKNFKRKAKIDWGTIPGSYAWVFPSKNKLNIGVGGPVSIGHELEKYLDQWLEFNGLKKDEIKLIGHPEKCRINKKTPILKDRIILIGEAAGLVDYWTGEGIYYAIKSAKIAAPIIEKSLVAGNIEYLKEYEKEIDREIMPELEGAYVAAKIFRTYSWPIHKMAKYSKRMFRIGYEIVSGGKKYSDFKKVSNALKWIVPGMK